MGVRFLGGRRGSRGKCWGLWGRRWRVVEGMEGVEGRMVSWLMKDGELRENKKEKAGRGWGRM